MKPDDRVEQLQADHEQFLQAFERPTQIYRYLRTRNQFRPIFLHRCLTFMQFRSSRTNARRKTFRVDSLLDIKVKDSIVGSPGFLKSYLTFTFLGFYDKKRDKSTEKISVELLLVKFSHKKRKESSSPVVQISLGTSDVPVNPSEDNPPNKAPALSIPSEKFERSDGNEVKSYTLVIRVYQSPMSQMTNGSVKGEENLEPSMKRRKLLRGSTEDEKVLSAEMVVFDKHARYQLTEGEYELVMNEVSTQSMGELDRISPKRTNSTWDSIDLKKTEKHVSDQFDVFGSTPTLKFRLSWSGEAAGSMVERPRPLMPRGFNASKDIGGNGIPVEQKEQNGNVSMNMNCQNGRISKVNGINGKIIEKPTKIMYQFIYNKNSRQTTEALEDLHCPWCFLNCMELYALLKHLKLSHPRFLFTYVPVNEGARIDVTVSELYDSTYVGNPHDLICQPPGLAFSRKGPVQRTPVTNVLVCKPKRHPKSLSEFLETDGNCPNDPNGPYDGQRPFVSGHNRLYHYSTTSLPMPPYAIMEPSTEDQVDPPWLMTKICRMIDDFSDVNDGEKAFMKMWTMHVQKHTYVGDCQMNLGLDKFLEECGQELMSKNLYRNFVLHCCNLFEFGVISPIEVFRAIVKAQNVMQELKAAIDPVQQDWIAQRKRWLTKQPTARVHQQPTNFSGIFPKETSTSQSDSALSTDSKLPSVVLKKLEPNFFDHQ